MAIRADSGRVISVSGEQLNAFLAHVANHPTLQGALRRSGPAAAANLANAEGFAVTIGDLVRYKSRATTWQLSDAELAVVAQWQHHEQPYWWQHIWRVEEPRARETP